MARRKAGTLSEPQSELKTPPNKTPQETWEALVAEGFSGPKFRETVLSQEDPWEFLIGLCGDLHRHNQSLREEVRRL